MINIVLVMIFINALLKCMYSPVLTRTFEYFRALSTVLLRLYYCGYCYCNICLLGSNESTSLWTKEANCPGGASSKFIYLLCFASKHHTIIALKKLGHHNSLTPITVGPLQNININIENRNN